jgi:HSP20 family protein
MSLLRSALVPRRSDSVVPRRNDALFPVEQWVNSFFDEFWKDNPVKQLSASTFPKMNVYEKDGQFVVTAMVPGMKSDDLTVEIEDGVLSLSGRMSEEYRTPEGSAEYVRELRSSSFERRISLPEHVDGEPEAVMKDGVLRLSFQTKQPEQVSTAKRIAIKAE